MTNPTTTITLLPPIDPTKLTPAAVLPMDGSDTITGKVTLQELGNALTGQMDAIDPAQLTGSSTVTVRGADGKAGVTTMVELTKVITVYESEGDTSYAGPGGVPTKLAFGHAGQILIGGPSGVPEWFTLNLAALATLLGQSIPLPVNRVPFLYPTAGSYSHTVSAGVTSVEVELWGPGGSGFASSPYIAAGGGGAYVWAQKVLTPATVLSIVVGASGSSTTINTTEVVAHTGGAATSMDFGHGGTGTSTWTNLYTVAGQDGGAAGTAAPGGVAIGGAAFRGGAGAMAQSITASSATSTGQQNFQSPGGGAAGNFTGADGMVIVWEYQ